jgi:putative flippase GtrA
MIARIINHRFVRFLAVGTMNTLFSYGVYAAFVYVGLNYAVANFISLIAGILFSFRTQGALVFQNRDKRLFGRFVVCWGLIYAANILFIKTMMGLGFDAYVAGAMALPFIVVLSYMVQKLYVFRVPKSPA